MRKTSVVSALLFGALSYTGPASADPVTLPSADCGLGPTNNCVVFQDFTVYSLPLLQEYQDPSGQTPDYPLTASLQGLNLVAKPNEAVVRVYWTSAEGTAAQGTGTSIDDPYDARTGAGNTGDNLLALMATALYSGQFKVPSDPAGGPGTADNFLQPSTTVVNTATFTGQSDFPVPPAGYDPATCGTNLNGCLPLWDADVSALQTALGANTGLVFFFVNNETGDSGELLGQDLNAWVRVCLTDTTTVGQTVVLGPNGQVCFTLSGNTVNGVSGLTNGFGDAQVLNSTDILPTAGDVWAHVHSDICVADGNNGPIPAGTVFPGACGSDVDPITPGVQAVTGKTINQSLGQNEGTFALVSTDLDTAFLSGKYDLLTIDGRLANLNDGGDLFWIAAGAPRVVPVPQPGTLTLAGLGLALLAGMLGWRRRVHAAG